MGTAAIETGPPPAPSALVGQPLKRSEDPALLRGRGRFVDDLCPPGWCAVAFVRAPHARARIRQRDATRARRAAGVLDVVLAENLGLLRPIPVNRAFFPSMVVPVSPPLASADVVAVGTPVAAVVAETPWAARDAAALVDVEYEPLPSITESRAALESAPIVPGLEGNRLFERRLRSGDVAGAFAAAEATVSVTATHALVSSVTLETRGMLARFDQASGELTAWVGTQSPARLRAELAEVFGLAEAAVRVVSADVGGGFGAKADLEPEYVVVVFVALRLGRPVKWVATRHEDFLTALQGRGGLSEGQLAVARDGRITAVRARILYPLGGRLSYGGATPPWHHARALPGPYRIAACDIETAGVLTTTASTGPYRGAGRPEATFLIERLIDEAARALGVDPAELRRRNLIGPDEFPFETITGQSYDSGDYARALDLVLALAGYADLRRLQAERRQRGEIVGIGVVVYVEPSARGWEAGAVRIERTGTVTASTGSGPSGQGHATAFAQVVADALNVELGAVTLRHGDTHVAPVGFGSVGSRGAALGGGALAQTAAEVREKGRRIAARILEAAPEDVRSAPGGFSVAGMEERRVSWREIADVAYGGALPGGESPGLEAAVFFSPPGETWGFGAIVTAIHIDRDTGRLAIEKLVWVDDAGTVINPLLVEGQLHGGLAQGYGQAVLEQIVYDPSGQLLTASLMDYAIPRADDVPEPVLAKTVTPSPRNPIGAKGVGEAGCIAVPAALVNAVADALAPLGAPPPDMPITPEKLWRILARGGPRRVVEMARA